MTPAQIDELFIEWNRYGDKAKKETLEEFLGIAIAEYRQEDFLEFLRDRLMIYGNWKNVGVA